MGELINGRTPEKILFNIRECAYGACLSECPYDGSDDCMEELLNDALALIERLESERDAAIMGEVERLPTVDAVPVVRCRDCVLHGHCTVEDIFILSGFTDGYCRAGKRTSNVVSGARMDGDADV